MADLYQDLREAAELTQGEKEWLEKVFGIDVRDALPEQIQLLTKAARKTVVVLVNDGRYPAAISLLEALQEVQQ